MKKETDQTGQSDLKLTNCKHEEKNVYRLFSHLQQSGVLCFLVLCLQNNRGKWSYVKRTEEAVYRKPGMFRKEEEKCSCQLKGALSLQRFTLPQAGILLYTRMKK